MFLDVLKSYCWRKQLSNFLDCYLGSRNHSDCELMAQFIQLDFFEIRMGSARLGTYLDRFALKNCADSAKYQPDWSSSVRFWNFVSYEDMCRYLRVFEVDLSKSDLFVQSRLKPAWRASRAENLLKSGPCVQSRLKLAWRASRAENSLKFVLFVQLRLKPAWRASRAENLLKFAFFVCFWGIWVSGYAHVSWGGSFLIAVFLIAMEGGVVL